MLDAIANHYNRTAISIKIVRGKRIASIQRSPIINFYARTQIKSGVRPNRYLGVTGNRRLIQRLKHRGTSTTGKQNTSTGHYDFAGINQLSAALGRSFWLFSNDIEVDKTIGLKQNIGLSPHRERDIGEFTRYQSPVEYPLPDQYRVPTLGRFDSAEIFHET